MPHHTPHSLLVYPRFSHQEAILFLLLLVIVVGFIASVRISLFGICIVVVVDVVFFKVILVIVVVLFVFLPAQRRFAPLLYQPLPPRWLIVAVRL